MLRDVNCLFALRGNLELEEKIYFDILCNILNAREEVMG